MVSAGAAGGFISVLIASEIHQQLSAQKILVGAMALFTAGLAGLALAPGLGCPAMRQVSERPRQRRHRHRRQRRLSSS